MAPFPFVVCSPRSGSTLLRAMLSAHSQLAIPPESHFLMLLLARRQSLMDGDRLAFNRFFDVLAEHPRFERWGLGQEDIVAAHEDPPTSLVEAIRCLYRAYARKHGKARYGDKTPGYALNVTVLAELIPESVFVHLVRDGRDVATSLLAAPFGPSKVEECAVFWKARVQAAVEAGVLLSGRYIEIRYENLVRAPEPELRAVCALADLDFEPGMLDYQLDVEAVIASTTDPTIHDKLREQVHMARNWRKELSQDDVRRFEAVAGDVLCSLGYPIGGDR